MYSVSKSHFHFLFAETSTVFSCCIISVTLFSATMQVIYGKGLQCGELYHGKEYCVMLLQICSHFHFLFAKKILQLFFSCMKISLTFYTGTTQFSFLIFNTNLQYDKLYHVRQFQKHCMSISCLQILLVNMWVQVTHNI